jgi:1-phosphatidylinositol-3-phosphate 5-kinase
VVCYRKTHHDHLSSLTKQLLSDEGLSLSWESIILETANKISHFVKPDVRNEGDEMDIREYVQIKKVYFTIVFVGMCVGIFLL